MQTDPTTRLLRYGPLLALLLAASARWLVADAHPEAVTTLPSEALGCTWAALLLTLWPRPKNSGAPQNSGCPTHPDGSIIGMSGIAQSTWKPMLAGAMLLAGPVTLLFVRAPLADAASLTIALALTPVVIAVASAALGSSASHDVAGRIWPGLAAVAGLLLVLATPSLSDARTDAVLAAAPLLTGIGAAWFSTQSGSQTANMRFALTGAALASATAAALWWALTGRPTTSLVAVAWDGVIALLSVLTLARLGPTRWSAQFALLPLLVLLEGIALVHPAMTVRWLTGLLLLAAASLYLLLPQEQESGPTPG